MILLTFSYLDKYSTYYINIPSKVDVVILIFPIINEGFPS
jgi:hypothetical protein